MVEGRLVCRDLGVGRPTGPGVGKERRMQMGSRAGMDGGHNSHAAGVGKSHGTLRLLPLGKLSRVQLGEGEP